MAVNLFRQRFLLHSVYNLIGRRSASLGAIDRKLNSITSALTGFERNRAARCGSTSMAARQDAGAVASLSMEDIVDDVGPLSREPQVTTNRPLVVVISGPSGVGKDAVIKQLKDTRTDLYFVVTATSRPMRPGEVDGVDYIFVDEAQFKSWIESNDLLEYALVYGDYKGIPKEQVYQALARGTDVVLRLDIQGAATVKRLMPDIVSIFITADNEHELVSRLISRKTETLENLKLRVQTAREEMQHIRNFDYVVVNRDGRLEHAVDTISSIITAEKHRSYRAINPVLPRTC